MGEKRSTLVVACLLWQTSRVFRVRLTGEFVEWFDQLRDGAARKAIGKRIARVELGLFGDMHSVGGGVSELRLAIGPGYRVYFTRRDLTVVVLLCGGDKDSQSRDIERARALAAVLE